MATPTVRSDYTALIAEAREFDTKPAEYASRLLGAHSLIDRLADALEQVTAERDAVYTSTREAREVTLSASVPLGVPEGTQLKMLLSEVRAILSRIPTEGSET